MQNFYYKKQKSLLMLVYILFILLQSTDFMFYSVRNLIHISPSNYFLTDRSFYSFFICIFIIVSINLFIVYLLQVSVKYRSNENRSLTLEEPKEEEE